MKKTIILGFVLLLMMVGSAYAGVGPYALVTDSVGDGQDDFVQGIDDVYGKGTVNIPDACTEQTGACQGTVVLYVVNTQVLWNEGNPLIDVRGSNQPVTATGGTCDSNYVCNDAEVPITQLWAAASTVPGVYDLVMDANGNDQYNTGEPVDHATEGGFAVIPQEPWPIPEFTTLGAGAILAGALAIGLLKKRKK